MQYINTVYTNLISDANTLFSTVQGAAYISDPNVGSRWDMRVRPWLEKMVYTNLISDVNTLVSTAQGAAYVSDPDFGSGRDSSV